MGYNREDFIRIREEYSKKYLKAREAAELRAEELHAKIPELRMLDNILASTASKIMAAACSECAEQKISEVRAENEKLLAERSALLRAYGYPEDYTDPHYECELCADTGYIDTKICTCMKRALVMAGYESSGLGGLMRTQSFSNFSLDYYKDDKEAYALIERGVDGLKKFSEAFSEDTYKNFIFIGGTGLGKTHLSTSVATAVIEKGFDVLYVTACSMISDFEDKQFGFRGASSTDTSRYYSADLLIIDDFGTEMTNQFTLSCIYDVINSRMISRRSTIINTNLNKTEINSRYGDRITSRLFGEYFPILFRGHDIREQKIYRKV